MPHNNLICTDTTHHILVYYLETYSPLWFLFMLFLHFHYSLLSSFPNSPCSTFSTCCFCSLFSLRTKLLGPSPAVITSASFICSLLAPFPLLGSYLFRLISSPPSLSLLPNSSFSFLPSILLCSILSKLSFLGSCLTLLPSSPQQFLELSSILHIVPY